ncbi:C40 family peptidase [Enterocloster clostridioformis]|uniref:C40 family peptidase n=1 Tax=Enterocloster clostridioformis TaxID=1531 RepID=UPI000941EFEA
MRQEEKTGGGEGQEPHDKEAGADRAGKKRFAGKKPDKTEKAQGKADKAGRKLESAREKLAAQKPPKRPGLAKKAVRGMRTEVCFYSHNKIHEVEHENVGVEGAHKSELVAEAGTRKLVQFARRRYREHPARRVAKWERRELAARANLDFQKMATEHPELASNPLSRIAQKWKLKRQYARQARQATKQGARAAKKTAGTITKRAVQAAARHPAFILIIVVLFLLFYALSAFSSLIPMLGSGLVNAISGTSYASADSDLLGADKDYTALENDLKQKIANIERTHSGYDEYRYNVDEIGHNPYELTSYLSAKYHGYTRTEIQGELREVFEVQYELTLTEEVEIRYRTETSTDADGNETSEEVSYEYYILHVTLKNRTLPAVVNTRLDMEQKEIYSVMQELKGNKPYLWEGIYTEGGTETEPGYQIPGEALSDPSFAALIGEAEKYLGYPYVWGGSNPSTSFDCSGFVCWVFSNSGVHNLPRTTAQGIYNQCARVSPADAKPGDIIFFTGTYDSGVPVSHVGIYVGNNMMIHCGNPIQYASTDTSYWQQHFYAFGRLSGN